MEPRPTNAARERFAATGSARAPVRAVILASWERCRMSGVVPDNYEVPFDGSPIDPDSRFVRAARPVLDRLGERLADTPTVILLSDEHARVLRRWTGAPEAGAVMDHVRAAEGFVWREELAGTNGIGTPLESGSAVEVVGGEHYATSFDIAACCGAPIRHPVTRRTEGVVSLTCRSRDANPLQLPLVIAVAREIEERLLADCSQRERRLFDRFVAARRRSPDPLVCVNDEVVIASPSAARLLGQVDQGLLWEEARRAIEAGGDEHPSGFTLPGDCLRARARTLRDGDVVVGALIAIERDAAKSHRAVPSASMAVGLAGRSLAWRAVVAAVTECARARLPVAVCGEPGTGKLALVVAIAPAEGPAGPVTVFEASDEELDGTRWVRRVSGRLAARKGTVVLRHLPSLSSGAARALLAPVEEAIERGAPWVAATCAERVRRRGEAWRALHDRIAARRLEVPPLRVRPEDVPDLADALLRAHLGPAHAGRFRPEAIQLLQRLDWPGNVRELDNVVRLASSRRHAGAIRLEDLPVEVRTAGTRAPGTPLQRLELDAIVAALDGAGGNKVEAARALGIARSTLYRKLRAYGLELDRRAF